MNIKTFFKVFVCMLAILGANISVFAQQDSYYIPPDIHDSSAEGKRALAMYRMVFRNNPPMPKAGVNDWEKILTDRERELLDSLLAELKRTAHINATIITLDTFCIKTEKFIDISSRIADKWGVGRKGVTRGLLISFSAGHRVALVESGFGDERLLTETQTKIVADQYMLPMLSQGKYYDALKEGIAAIANMLSAP